MLNEIDSSKAVRGRQPGLPGGLVAVLLLAASVLSVAARAETLTARVPVYLDYPLLNHLLVTQLFPSVDRSREILNDPSGCNRVLLSEPALAPDQGSLEISARVGANLGLAVLGTCRSLVAWNGGAHFIVRPLLQADGRSVRLEPQETWLIDVDGNKILSGPVWEAAHRNLLQLLRGFVIDLTPYFDAISSFLPEVLPQKTSPQLQAMVDSLALGSIEVQPESLNLSLEFLVEVPPPTDNAAAALTEAELKQFDSRWQMMDALLVGAIKQYAAATSLQALRSTLLEILLDSRYRLRDALTDDSGRADDEVRHLFIDSWQRLGPVVRQIALEQTGQEHWLWLTALSATDALNALDQMGPALGLDISTSGLRRLARMVNADQAENLLRYTDDVDPQLQELWHQEVPASEPAPEASYFDFFLFPKAHAAAADRLKLWVPARDELGTYLPLVDDLLLQTSGNVLRQNRLEPDYAALYEKLVVATAWQESCWRQYMVENKRTGPLRSDSGDVGLMQVNERVWRGFYDLQKLRWDIDYNAGAGAEILFNYMTRYALKKGEHRQSGGLANLARASYSAYNGGPGQVARYRRTDVPAAHRKIDRLFWEKYQEVDAGNAMNVARCLGGEPPKTSRQAAQAATPKTPAPAARMTAGTDPGGSWLRQQPAANFTLQLASFSSRESADRFLRDQSLAGKAQVASIRQGPEYRFVVLYGSYASRAKADPALQQFQKLKPWLRKIEDLRK